MQYATLTHILLLPGSKQCPTLHQHMIINHINNIHYYNLGKYAIALWHINITGDSNVAISDTVVPVFVMNSLHLHCTLKPSKYTILNVLQIGCYGCVNCICFDSLGSKWACSATCAQTSNEHLQSPGWLLLGLESYFVIFMLWEEWDIFHDHELSKNIHLHLFGGNVPNFTTLTSIMELVLGKYSQSISS